MGSIIRNVRDIESDERRVIEHVVGHRLQENQRIIIQIVNMPIEPANVEIADERTQVARLPEWCNVFDGLTDEQIGAVEGVVRQRSELSRPSE